MKLVARIQSFHVTTDSLNILAVSDHAKRSDLVVGVRISRRTSLVMRALLTDRVDISTQTDAKRAISVGLFAGVSFHDSADSLSPGSSFPKGPAYHVQLRFANEHAPIFVTADDTRTVLDSRQVIQSSTICQGKFAFENSTRDLCRGTREHLQD